MWQAGCWRRLLSGSRVQEEVATWQQCKGGGYYVAAGYRRRVQEQAAAWQHGTGGGYGRRVLFGSRVQEEGTGGGPILVGVVVVVVVVVGLQESHLLWYGLECGSDPPSSL